MTYSNRQTKHIAEPFLKILFPDSEVIAVRATSIGKDQEPVGALIGWTSVEEPRGFLYVTAANLVRDHWRKLERERSAVRRATAEAAVRPDTEQTDPSVRLLVQSLPERLRVPILLHYYADMPIREVSALTGRKEGTVKADLHAARELLRVHLRRSLDHTP